MPFQAVLFDLDGTLVNSIDDIAESMNEVLKNHNLQIYTRDEYMNWIGNGLKQLVYEALPEEERDSDQFIDYLKEMKDIYSKRWMLKTAVYPKVELLLDNLLEVRISKCILSNKPDKHTQVIAEKLLSKWDFDVVMGLRDGYPRKPDPSSAIEIAEKMKIAPSDFLYLGDSGIDMMTANSAGMYAVGVTWGYKSRENIIEGGAKEIIDDPLDILQLIE